MNISGIAAGYVGPGGKTIVPSRAEAGVDIRLVGGDPEAAAAAVRHHLEDHGFGHVRVNLLDAYPWAKAPPGNRSEVAMRASYRALGRTTLPSPAGPWCAPTTCSTASSGCPGRRAGSATRPAPTVPTSTPPWPGWRSTSSARPPSCSPTRT